uniref:CSON000741 protein n=1 Tax=Culicoides sonorensis TaxID=179676 RepID=A0A336LQ46_CULSO
MTVFNCDMNFTVSLRPKQMKNNDIQPGAIKMTTMLYGYIRLMDTFLYLFLYLTRLSKGRIDAAQCVGNETKRPILLPPHHYVTQLLLEKYHNEYKHLHHETVINEFRQKYMVKSARRLLKHILNHCPTCAYLNAKPEPPEMAPLPHARLAAYMRQFTYVGIDCMGPLTVTIGRRSEKRWICLYTCLTIRAVQLEVLYKMDASSFIMSYRNFTQRRGAPSEVYLDNGSNFVGGERLMREELSKVDMMEVAAHFTSPETKWKFNPPDSPHMGGSWERLVKSVKTAFYATSGRTLSG